LAGECWKRSTRHELARSRFVRLQGTHVAGTTPTQTSALMKGVEWASEGRRHMFVLHADTGSMTVACVPLGHAPGGRPRLVLLMLSRCAGTQGLAVSFFSRMHGLTPAEEGVLKALCDGLGVSEIATANGVAESTVRTQVRSLRDKTGFGSMRLLVQHIAGLPPLVPVVLGTPEAAGLAPTAG
jgi:DNA-binding CsgD family transcriptional regulator